MELDSETELIVKVPSKVHTLLKKKRVDIEKIINNALREAIDTSPNLSTYQEIDPNLFDIKELHAADIPPGSFIVLPGLKMEMYEKIVDETSWEYLSGVLIHHSHESNYHNAIVGFLWTRARNTLDSHQFIIRGSQIALSIGDDKPEPDLMIFDRDLFQRKRRMDNSESEIIESAPLIVIEVISKSSFEVDQQKKDKYLIKGIKEYWQIFFEDEITIVKVWEIKQGKYELTEYKEGEIRSRILPFFACTIDELMDPDKSK
jgi:Uma2 family endonuclease